MILSAYLIVTAVFVVVTLLGTIISYFDRSVKMSTSRLWAKAFFLSFVWPVGVLMLVGAIFIWAFGTEKSRQKVFG